MNTYLENTADIEKKRAAILSVIAAVFLTLIKFIVGFSTGSLGILSEALHSTLDFIAAMITFLAVRISSKPADTTHNYGHGKVENLSALLQTILLLITCAWIIYEGLNRIITGHTDIEVNFWSFAVVIVSIFVDYTRSSHLKKIARKYNSQALEADALHFSTDIFSSLVVLVGLIGALLNFHSADSIAALIVALIVLWISFRLGQNSIDALLDKSPSDIELKVRGIVESISEVTFFHDIKVRTSGPYIFIELNIHVDPKMTIFEAHEVSELVESKIKEQIERCEVHTHIEPAKSMLN